MTKFLATTAVALMLASPVWAQSQSSEPSDHGAASHQSAQNAKLGKVPMNELSMVGSDTLRKSKVRDASGKQIGKIDDIVVDTQSGQVAYAIISANGKDHVVPWQRLQASNQPETFTLNANRQALDSAPTVDRSTLAELRNPQDQQRIAAFWQNQPQQAEAPSTGGEPPPAH